MAEGQVLAVGCEECNDGLGQINFYDARTLNRAYELKGDSDHKKLGKQMLYRLGTGYSENFWYTSTKGSKTSLNTIVFFRFIDTEDWVYDKTEGLVSIVGSDIVYAAPIKNNFLYKGNYSKDLRTFVACDYNSRYNSDDTDDDKYNATHILAYRNCSRCPEGGPFSYGYQDVECHPCGDFAPELLENGDPYVRFYHGEACGEARLPVSCEDDDSCEHYEPDEVDDSFSEGEEVEESGAAPGLG